MQHQTHTDWATTEDNGALSLRTHEERPSGPTAAGLLRSVTHPPATKPAASAAMVELESSDVRECAESIHTRREDADPPEFPDGLDLHVTSNSDGGMSDDNPDHIRKDHVDIIVGVVVGVAVLVLALCAFFWFVRKRRERQIKRATGQV